jgi:hypothetical protein
MLRTHWLVAAMLAAGCSAPASAPPKQEPPPSPDLVVAAPEGTVPREADAGLVLAPMKPPQGPATPPRKLELPDPGAGGAQSLRAPQNDGPTVPLPRKPYVPPPKLDSQGRGPANRVDPANPPSGTVPLPQPAYEKAPAKDR